MSAAPVAIPHDQRGHLGRVIVTTAREHAECFRRTLTEADGDAAKADAEKAACAASNTGWYILKALGYSDQEIRDACS